MAVADFALFLLALVEGFFTATLLVVVFRLVFLHFTVEGLCFCVFSHDYFNLSCRRQHGDYQGIHV